MIKKASIIAILVGVFSACASVKEYQKVKLSDPDMAFSQKKINRFETSYQVYREAASGANGGKSGGGCGCN